MSEKDNGLDRLCQIYDILDDNEKAILIKLAENLINSQKIIVNGKERIKEKSK